MRRSVPANVDAAIRKGLEKLPADRFTGAHDFAQALQDPLFRHGHGVEASASARGAAGLWRWVAAAAVVVSLGLSVALVGEMSEPQPVRRVERFAMPFLPGDEIEYTGNSGYRISPDGTMLVYRHDVNDSQVLVVPRWDELSAAPIRDTQGASQPAVSPDGLELAFTQGGEIKVLAFAGGPVRTLAEGFAPEWGADGYVYAGADSGMVRVPSSGGAVETLTTLAEGEDAHLPFDVLPGGKRLLYFTVSGGGSEFEVRGLDLSSGESTPIVAGLAPRYVSSGYLL